MKWLKQVKSPQVSLGIQTFKNPGGSFAYRVSGTVHGNRVQKNFPTLQEAETLFDALVRASAQVESEPRRMVYSTFATDEDLHDAQLAHKRLRAALPKGSLVTAVDFYLAHGTVVVTDIGAMEAVEKFHARRLGRGNQQVTADNSFVILQHFVRSQGLKKISEAPGDAVKRFVFDTNIAERTRRDRYDILHNFGEFLRSEKYLAKNLTEDITRPKVTYDGDVTYLTVAQCQALLDAAAVTPCGGHRIRGSMLPYFAACMLSGMRPDETPRLKWSSVSFPNGVMTGFRAKTPRPRSVAMHDQLPSILERCKEPGLSVTYFSRKSFEKVRSVAAAALGSEIPWDNDILRHSYASHHYAWKNDMNFLTKNMGNSEAVLRASYINQTVLLEDGMKYFQMRPGDFGGLGRPVPRTPTGTRASFGVVSKRRAAP